MITLFFIPLVFGIDDIIAGLILTVGSGLIQYFSQEETNASNEAMLDKQLDWQEKMQDKQNEYNKPVNQIARMKEAGINPTSLGMGNSSSAAGGLSAGVGTPSAIAKVSPLAGLAGDFGSVMSGLLSGSQSNTENSLREYRIAQAAEDANKLRQEARLLGLDAANQEIVNKYADAMQQLAYMNGHADINLKLGERAQINQNIKEMQYRLEAVLPEEVKKIISERNINVLRLDEVTAVIADTYASMDKKRSEQQLIDQQIQTEILEQQNLEQQTEHQRKENESYDKVTSAYIAKYGAEINSLAADASLKSEQAYWYVYEMSDKIGSKIYGQSVGWNKIGNARRAQSAIKRTIKSRTKSVTH